MISKITALVLILAIGAQAWGPQGHQIAAGVAMKFLSNTARSSLATILAGDGDGDLVQVATWADTVRSNAAYSWSGPLHYINTPDWECAFTPASDCADDFCVSGAIANYSSQILSTTSGTADVAAKFITHFVGDVHQPLHVAFASDHGGNLIKGNCMGRSSNLHACWDTTFVVQRLSDGFNSDQSSYVSYLINMAQSTNMSSWTQCFNSISAEDAAAARASFRAGYFDAAVATVLQSAATCADAWANETAALACKYAYTDDTGAHITTGFSLQDSYYQFIKTTIDDQLAKAGVRMAALFSVLLA